MAASTSGMRKEKHVWTPEEDVVLVQCLVHLVQVGGWRGDNGTFRPGFHSQLGKLMRERIPGCNIVVSPNIESRVKLLKRQYMAITEMMGPACSGFGWNDERKCIEAEKAIFDAWVEGHPQAKGLRNRPFPWFNELAFVFGKDSARGGRARTPSEITTEPEPVVDLDEDMNVEFDDCYVPSPPIVDPTPSEEHSGTPTSRPSSGGTCTRQSRRRLSIGNVAEVLENGFQLTAQQIEKIAMWPVKKEEMERSRRKELYAELQSIPGVSMDDGLVVARALLSDENMMTHFMDFPPEWKYDYCMEVLGRARRQPTAP